MKRASDGSERRKAPRVRKRVHFHIQPREGGALVARSINLSRNGVCCQVAAPVPVMTVLNVRFRLPPAGRRRKEEFVECGGVVVRSEKVSSPSGDDGQYNVAIFFSGMSRASEAGVAKLVERP